MKDLGAEGRVILKLISKKLYGGMGWIALAQDRDGWLSLVRAVMNLLVDYLLLHSASWNK